MLKDTIRKLIDRFHPAGHKLRSRAGGGEFVCRGRVRVKLASNAIVAPPTHRSYLGIAYFDEIAPPGTVTIISVQPRGRLWLDEAIIGRGAVLRVGADAVVTIGSNS